MLSYLELDTSNFPNMYEINLGKNSYFYRLNYADDTQVFTIDLYDYEEKPIVLGEPLIIGKTLWQDIIHSRLPSTNFTLVSTNGDPISLETLNRTVFLSYGGTSDDTVLL